MSIEQDSNEGRGWLNVQLCIDNVIRRLVVVAHYVDFDLMDATILGRLEKVKEGYFYLHGSNRGYRHCRLVSEVDWTPKMI
jgi:hypothetical protein